MGCPNLSRGKPMGRSKAQGPSDLCDVNAEEAAPVIILVSATPNVRWGVPTITARAWMLWYGTGSLVWRTPTLRQTHTCETLRVR